MRHENYRLLLSVCKFKKIKFKELHLFHKNQFIMNEAMLKTCVHHDPSQLQIIFPHGNNMDGAMLLGLVYSSTSQWCNSLSDEIGPRQPWEPTRLHSVPTVPDPR